MIESLLILPAVLALIGIACGIVQFCRLFVCTSTPIIDRGYKCLDGDPNKIREVSIRFAKDRGSIRLSRGNFKSVEEVKSKEKDILFP